MIEYRYACLEVDFCSIIVISYRESVREIQIIGKNRLKPNKSLITKPDYIIKYDPYFLSEPLNELRGYFNGALKRFSFPIEPQGTSFQKTVWKELQKIPYGETVCYQEIAERVQNPGAYRAVGMANNRNPIPIVIPCHRVIGKNGSLVGFGQGIEIKQKLLEHEKTFSLNLS